MLCMPTLGLITFSRWSAVKQQYTHFNPVDLDHEWPIQIWDILPHPGANYVLKEVCSSNVH